VRTVGFEFMFCCSPLREWGNWKWGSYDRKMAFCVGPMRFKLTPVQINRKAI
jgi:hypothetical protein